MGEVLELIPNEAKLSEKVFPIREQYEKFCQELSKSVCAELARQEEYANRSIEVSYTHRVY